VIFSESIPFQTLSGKCGGAVLACGAVVVFALERKMDQQEEAEETENE
jgi:hypothetical protein